MIGSVPCALRDTGKARSPVKSCLRRDLKPKWDFSESGGVECVGMIKKYPDWGSQEVYGGTTGKVPTADCISDYFREWVYWVKGHNHFVGPRYMAEFLYRYKLV